ncbi:MAG: flippase-like domain-containing protein, partial [Saprospiraceae bacterium]|nr:flippase-like domain-containing protein [Saprospiraceae bacterium]
MGKKILQFLFFLGFGLAIFALVFRSQNEAFQEQCRLDGVPGDQCSLIQKLMDDFSTVHVGWLAAVMVAFTVSNIFRAARWQMLMEPMGYKIRFSNSLLTILLGYFANLGFPRMGEVVRAGSLARYEKTPLEKVMGTLVIDRLVDVVCLGLVVGLAFLFEGDTLLGYIQNQHQTGTEPQGPSLSAILLMVFAMTLAIGYLFRARLTKLTIYKKGMNMVQGFWEGLKSVLKLKNPVLFTFYSLGIWLMFYLQCYFNLKAFPPTANLDMSAALMVFVFGTLGFVIPSPGGMGTFHGLCIAALALYGINGG